MNTETIEELKAQRDAARSELAETIRINEQLKADGTKYYSELGRTMDERDAAQKACAEMRALANAIHDYKATGYTGIDIDLALEVINSTDCGRDYEHKSKREQAEKACAVYRAALVEIRDVPTVSSKCCLVAADALESTDCGKDYHHNDEWKSVVEALREAISRLKAWGPAPADALWIQGSGQKALARAEKLLKGEA